MIRNTTYTLKKSSIQDGSAIVDLVERLSSVHVLRWYVARATEEELLIEATEYLGALPERRANVLDQHYPGKTAVVNLIPTGVGCEFGGYAGDAAPITSLLAGCSDYLVTNPNAVNASNFIAIDRNVLYTEGHCIDAFAKGQINLHVPFANKVGLIVEKTSDENIETVYNIVNAIRAIHGVNVVDVVVTDERIGGRCVLNSSGAYVGTIDNPGALFRACERLIASGANAIGVTSNVQDLPTDFYAQHFSGLHPNPVGGVEAVISHLICKKYQVPAAHGPMINKKDFNLADAVVDARGAGEISSASGLACVLIGLHRAPQFGPARTGIRDTINFNNVAAVVAPASALGGVPVLYAQKHGIPVIAVRSNTTVLNVTSAHLSLRNVIEVENYTEAAGVLLALKTGISLSSIYRPLDTLRQAPVLAAELYEDEDELSLVDR